MDFTLLLAKLRLIALYYQTAHWQVKGTTFYADHLLFERLYNTVNEEIDGVAEKAVGITKKLDVVDLTDSLKLIAKEAPKLPYACKDNTMFVNAALELEQDLLDYLDKNFEKQSLGVQDLLAHLANTHESNCYLLRQRSATG